MMKLLVLSLVGVAVCLCSAIPTSTQDKTPRFLFANVTGGGTYQSGAHALFQATVSDKDDEVQNDDWKFCTWTRLKDNSFCQFSYVCDGFLCDIGSGDFSIETVCSPALRSRVKFEGEDPNYHNRRCGLQFDSLNRDDSSLWRVEIEECKITGCGSSDGNDIRINANINVTVV